MKCRCICNPGKINHLHQDDTLQTPLRSACFVSYSGTGNKQGNRQETLIWPFANLDFVLRCFNTDDTFKAKLHFPMLSCTSYDRSSRKIWGEKTGHGTWRAAWWKLSCAGRRAALSWASLTVAAPYCPPTWRGKSITLLTATLPWHAWWTGPWERDTLAAAPQSGMLAIIRNS